MSSKLNLVPEIPVVIGQSVIFLANFIVVKKLFFDPYIKLRTAREALTMGSKDDSLDLQLKAKTLSKEVDDAMATAFKEVGKMREAAKTKATEERTKILQEVDKGIQSELQSFRNELKENLSKERSQLSATVDRLSTELFATLVNN